MTHTDKTAAGEVVADRILKTDIALLDDHNVGDQFMSIMVAEHGARVETLAKIVEPTLGRSLLLMVAGALISAAKQIEDATVMEAELIHV